MKRYDIAFLAWALLSVSHWAAAFELSTHAALTEHTVIRFLRDRPLVMDDLGFPAASVDSLLSQPIGNQYADMFLSNNAPPQRAFNQFEQDVIRRVDPAMSPRSVTGWVMAGAIREDDIPSYLFAANPQDDPYANIIRVLNHFYDPVYQRALTPCPLAPCELAPIWATGVTDAFGQANGEILGRWNHFTILDAKEALFRALTLKTRNVARWSDIPQPPDAAGKEVLRNVYWATMFRSLGDVLHLVQDMAQPQHTRNDAHAGIVGAGHKGVLELYLEARARLETAFKISPYGGPSTTVAIAAKPLSYQICDTGNNCGDYPPPTEFTQYSQFFSTSPGIGVGGKGLADYSNTQFFTAGKNLGNTDYSSPPNNLSAYTMTPVVPTHWDGSPIVGSDSSFRVFLFNRGIVLDNLNLAYNATNVPLTSVSIWDEFMQGRAFSPSFHITRENFDAQADLLLPRAVAYGVGLLARFFRGQMQIDTPNEGAYAVLDNAAPLCRDVCGFTKIKLKLTNNTPAETMSRGTFFAVAKFHRNNCYTPDFAGEPGGSNFPCPMGRGVAEEIVVSNPVDLAELSPPGSLRPDTQAAIIFTFATPIPINATDIYLQVVFRGQLGSETDAVVVATKNISEPNYIAIVNDYDYTYNYVTDTFQAVAPDPQTQTIAQIDVKLGNATAPIATLPSLGVRGYAQLAFLTDIGSTGTEQIVIDLNAPGFGPWIALDLPVATFDSPGAGVYDRTRHVIKYRGMWSDYRFDLFQGYRYGMESCAPLDTRRVCTSAGLTAITPANAVAWTINFP